MKRRTENLNINKIIVTAIILILLIAIVAILTKVLTNKKEAVYVSSEESNASLNVAAESSNNNTWKINNSSTNSETNLSENKIDDNTEKTNSTNNINETNTTAKNETDESRVNNIVENTTSTKEESKENTANNTANNTTKATTNNNSSKDSSAVKGVIWLTFDDGPSANITPKILDILKKENIKATFFVINYSDSNEHLLKREAEEGHTIGIHGYSHEYSKIYKSKETFMSNVYTLQERIQKSTGIKSMYTRFPGGSSNTVSRKYCKGIMTELTKEMLAKGFKYYDWNISSGDAGGAKNAKDVYNNVTKNLSKKRGNMVLMHDFGGNKKGLEALPNIIKYGKENGYTFAAIDDNTPMYAQHVNN